MNNVQRKTATLTLVITILGLSACSSDKSIRDILLDASGVKYQKNESVKNLEVPPDLTAPEFDEAFVLPSGVVSAVSIQNNETTARSQPKSSSPSDLPVGFRLNANKAGNLSRVETITGKSVLQVNDTYDRSLILTKVMLARLGFDTGSKPTVRGVITAVYNGDDVTVDGNSAGTLNKLLDLPNNNIVLANGKSYDVSITNEKIEGENVKRLPTIRFTRTDKKNIPNKKHAKIIVLLNKTFNAR